MSVLWLCLGLAAAPRPVLHVDLQAVVEAWPAAQAVARRVEAERARRLGALRQKEQAYQQQKGSEANRVEAFQALERERQDGEAALLALESEGLAPILKGLRARLPSGVYSLDQLPILEARSGCDRTAWFKDELAGKKAPLPPAGSDCTFDRFYVLDFDRALKESEAAQQTARDLDRQRDQRQLAFDQERRRLLVAGKGEAVVQEAYAAEQAALARAERAAQGALEARLFEAIGTLRGPGVLIFETPAAPVLGLEACEISEWVKAWLDGKKPAAPCEEP